MGRETGFRSRTWQVLWTLSDFGVESGKAGPPSQCHGLQTAARLQCRANIVVGYPLAGAWVKTGNACRDDGRGRTGNSVFGRISGSALAPEWWGRAGREGLMERCQENLISGVVGGVCHLMD